MRVVFMGAVIGSCIAILLCQSVYGQNAPRKLGRGLANIATGWAEMFVEIGRKVENDGDIAGIFVAPFTGLIKAVGRTLAGVYDTCTFIVPLPRGYKPLLEPEFVVE